MEQSPSQCEALAARTKSWCSSVRFLLQDSSPSPQPQKNFGTNRIIHAQSVSPSETDTQFDRDDYQAAETILCIKSWESKEPFSPTIQSDLDIDCPRALSDADARRRFARDSSPSALGCQVKTQACRCMSPTPTFAMGIAREPTGWQLAIVVGVSNVGALHGSLVQHRFSFE